MKIHIFLKTILNKNFYMPFIFSFCFMHLACANTLVIKEGSSKYDIAFPSGYDVSDNKIINHRDFEFYALKNNDTPFNALLYVGNAPRTDRNVKILTWLKGHIFSTMHHCKEDHFYCGEAILQINKQGWPMFIQVLFENASKQNVKDI